MAHRWAAMAHRPFDIKMIGLWLHEADGGDIALLLTAVIEAY
jgi:hypothetical protein